LFGELAIAIKPGKQPEVTDSRAAQEALLGVFYSITYQHYLTTIHVEPSIHHIMYEAQYGGSSFQPGP